MRAAACLIATWIVVSLITGCAVPAKTSINYVPPELPEQVENTVVLNESYDDVWSRLIGGLSTTFFVINNVEKASGLITLDFSTDSPERYVDCGVSTRTYNDEIYTYEVAGDATFPYDQKSGMQVAKQQVSRDTSLTGKINVHVAEVSAGTKVTVNVRYIWTNVVSGTYKMAGAVAALGPTQGLQPKTYTKSFNTNATSTPNNPDDFPCGANGNLEALILDIVCDQSQ